MNTDSKTVAIIGAGKLGVVVAQLALKSGYKVYIAGSGSPEKIRLSVQVLAPGAIVSTTEEAVMNADITILAIPLSRYRHLPSTLFDGKLIVDAMNYWWEVDGEHSDLKNPTTSTSEMVQSHLYTARVIKALSHMGYHHLFDEARPKNTSKRKAIAIAGNNDDDVRAVAQFVESLGFDSLTIGNLSNGRLLEPGQIAFGANVERKHLDTLLRKNKVI